jgi:hypothetical protein
MDQTTRPGLNIISPEINSFVGPLGKSGCAKQKSDDFRRRHNSIRDCVPDKRSRRYFR